VCFDNDDSAKSYGSRQSHEIDLRIAIKSNSQVKQDGIIPYRASQVQASEEARTPNTQGV